MKAKHFVIGSFIFLVIQIFNLSVIDAARSFTCSEGGFSIWMPGEPTLQRVNHKSFVGMVKENSYTLKTENEKYGSSYTQLPGIAFSFLSVDDILNKAKNGFLKASGAREVRFQRINFGGKEGRELAFQIPSEDNTNPTHGTARFFLSGKNLYVVTIIANEENGIVDRYLNSFKLLSPPAKDFTLNSF